MSNWFRSLPRDGAAFVFFLLPQSRCWDSDL